MITRETPGAPEDVPRPKTVMPIGEGESRLPAETVRPFRAYMEGGESNPLLAAGKSPQISPFDLAHGNVPAPGPTYDTLQQQAKVAQGTLGDVSNQLNTPKLKLKQSTKYLLKNKLNSANAHIRSASNKIGAPQVPSEEAPAGAGPIQKFLSTVTDGQKQLDAAQQYLSNLSQKGEEMKPADMLLVQIKLAKAQQEIEYSSMLLSKAVDDLKLLMNIQL